MKSIVLITGGSGLIGQSLSRLFLEKSWEVRWLTRSNKKIPGIKTFNWNPELGQIDIEAVKDVNAIIHLAGAGVADKSWTLHRKKELYSSRVESSLLLLRTCRDNSMFPHVFVSSSAVGYYGSRPGEILTESSAQGKGYLSELTSHWEAAADGFNCHKVRVVKMRTGVVLSPNGGSFPSFRLLSKIPLLPLPGNGNQQFPWIHEQDLAQQYYYAVINKTVTGVVNAVAPKPVRLKDFLRICSQLQGRIGLRIPTPSLPIRLLSPQWTELLLSDQQVIPEKLQELGFTFQFTSPYEAIHNILGK